eukprot:15334982-Ditylum_brightwellii.AAC.1
MNRQPGPGYGMLPPRIAPLVPWSDIAVDLIGPWKLNIQGVEVEFNALTSIDLVSNLAEIVRFDNKTAEHVAQKFENSWLARYPRPVKCIHDNGGEFIGGAFQQMLQRHGIRDTSTTAYNPQANSVCERLHLTVANILRASTNNRANNMQQAQRAVDDALATTMYTTRCAVSRSLGMTPGALAFHRDMLIDLPIIADLLAIQQKRQVLIDENLRRQNLKRRDWNYAVGEE